MSGYLAASSMRPEIPWSSGRSGERSEYQSGSVYSASGSRTARLSMWTVQAWRCSRNDGSRCASDKRGYIMARNIGLNVPIPETECEDVNCPFHGTLPVRGQVITGKVVSDRMNGTVVVEREFIHYVKKYKRYEKRRSR